MLPNVQVAPVRDEKELSAEEINIIHAVNNALTIISLRAQIITRLMEAVPVDNAKIAKAADVINSTTIDIAKTIKDWRKARQG